ncbi:hypothetical protein K440DRAFT_663834 [Wilcoxina mikolae CBS 423.85]|nr:hypothetical protein K440DRAFT_663834 [Wilcoxina mikolae CBS 423.85]
MTMQPTVVATCFVLIQDMQPTKYSALCKSCYWARIPNWPMFPNPVTGPDWESGKTFFIRNRRQPNLYWYVHGTHIHTSTERRAKFRIEKKTPGVREPQILIRDDKITIQVVAETVTSSAVKNTTYVLSENSEGRLQIGTAIQEWSFGDLLNKHVGVRWESENGCEEAEEVGETAKPYLVHMLNGGGDEWELA